MCGRFANDLPKELMQQVFRTTGPAPDWLASWNIAPRQPAPVVRRHPATGERRLDLLMWGLVPNWAKDMERQPINARAETVATSGMFRAAFRSRRCLVPATAYYEWKTGSLPRPPYAFARRDGAPLALAGLWESWEYEGDILRTFAIITTRASDAVRSIHDRMPVIVEERDQDIWLNAPPQVAGDLLHAAGEDVLRFWPIGMAVNSTRNNGPELLQAIG
ncbi:SOS response-associated peptidase [Gluconacetobacter tumulisoli]|uniref:Abasic site processing protein n=1 Tax=Gluconacetobacter tumulisoli TaxID=1286189 RepID=A0A7W4K805_9PROT|nr:SOS response-associated peptidase [Gluconacetobacter tumulisoli]MBB2201977.1 SOS response-associated peptidase [Gluconacetobacter tumulisoli]